MDCTFTFICGDTCVQCLILRQEQAALSLSNVLPSSGKKKNVQRRLLGPLVKPFKYWGTEEEGEEIGVQWEAPNLLLLQGGNEKGYCLEGSWSVTPRPS
jgi:hypothetical protein